MAGINLAESVIIGVDVHKRNHTAVIMDPLQQVIGKYTLGNTEVEYENFLMDVKSKVQEKKIVFGLEDTEANGLKLATYLYQQNYTVYHVPANYTEVERKHTPHIEKTDYLDARRVATVLLTKNDMLTELIVSKETETARELKGIIDDRRDMVLEAAKLKNQLQNLLYLVYGDSYKTVSRFKSLWVKKSIKTWLEKLNESDDFDSKRIRSKFVRLKMLQEEIEIINAELKARSERDPSLKLLRTIPGCGAILAAMIVAEIKDINRFRSSSALARYTGVAPRQHSSSTKAKKYTDRRGNRKLNYALFQLAVSQTQLRKTKEG